MNRIVSLLLLCSVFVISGCSLFRVYVIDVPQGSPLTQDQVQRVKVGMTPDQVAYYLGTPNINDTITPNRWDYVYMYLPGTYGDKAGIDKTIGKQKLSIYFDATPKVIQIEGQPTIPAEQPVTPLPDRLF